MKAILAVVVLVIAGVVSVQAQSGADYKHPYGLQKSKTKIAPAQTQRTKVADVRRNYKNPQREQGEVVVTTPGREVENVTNPLTSNDNYKRQNRTWENSEALPQENTIVVKDSTEKNRRKE